MTKAQEVFEKVEALIASGSSKADAFKKLAEEYGQPVNSIRGAYYTHSRQGDEPGSTKPRRTRRRETTAEDALNDAREALDRAMESIDREVEAARLRAEEAQAEYEALRDSAEAKKEAIAAKRDALA
ncbi:hypothetical protein LRS13_13870 [Svornostia abyssi]|uniref:KfrA N-terminal DNA-binding domain-containing protein n=1 Tax=Svornostia abyssi TaxID=2898438 RepID=A0ABY5PBA2_9ACTN|nr:hypothetical protein LRS13_13870 [Parviterribacteraceae bacterium J379]